MLEYFGIQERFFMAQCKNIDYSQVDWSLNNGEIARQLGISNKTVWMKRKRLNIPPATTRGRCNPNNRFTKAYLFSSAAKPKRELDHVFALSPRGDGRKKAGNAYRKAVLEIYGPQCQLCGYYKPPLSNHVHHIVPLSEGGLNTIRNGCVLCSRCHDEVHAGISVFTKS